MIYNDLGDLDLAYMAGLFDGEGSWSIQVDIKSYKGRESVWFNPRMSLNMKNSLTVQQPFLDLFGGKIYTSGTRTGMAQWLLTKRDSLTFATTQLLPYLRLKKPIAERFLEALSHFPESRKAHGNGVRSWSLEASLKVAEIALNLNPATAKRSLRGSEYLDLIRKTYESDAKRAA